MIYEPERPLSPEYFQQQVRNLMITALKGFKESRESFRMSESFVSLRTSRSKSFQGSGNFIINIAPLSSLASAWLMSRDSSWANRKWLPWIFMDSLIVLFFPPPIGNVYESAERLHRCFNGFQAFCQVKGMIRQVFCSPARRRISLLGKRPIDKSCFPFFSLSRMVRALWVAAIQSNVLTRDVAVVLENFSQCAWKWHEIDWKGIPWAILNLKCTIMDESLKTERRCDTHFAIITIFFFKLLSLNFDALSNAALFSFENSPPKRFWYRGLTFRHAVLLISRACNNS